MKDLEIWKPIVGFEAKYLVSNKGRVRSIDSKMPNNLTGGFSVKKGQILKTNLLNGYARVSLTVLGKSYNFFVHRLVAVAFIPNTNNCEVVNHIDGNKNNPDAKNLEWCSQKENIAHSFEVLNNKPNRVSLTLDLETGIYYDSAADAYKAKSFKITKNYLNEMLRGVKKNFTSLIYC